jgi:acyl-CoA thioester hydrolase
MVVTEPMGHPFVWQMRVYWEDTDGGGVVYHARYLNFFERARTEWLRSFGVNQSDLADEHGIVFAVRRMTIDFRLPARLDDRLEVTAQPVKLGAASVVFLQEMRRARDGEMLASARVEAACLAAETFRAVRLPAWMRQEIAASMDE